MKVFIGGSKIISCIDDNIRNRLREFINLQYDILIGDCRGVDTAVQKFFAENNYEKVTVYASGDEVRNNVGNFKVCNVLTDNTKGFEFYRKKRYSYGK